MYFDRQADKIGRCYVYSLHVGDKVKRDKSKKGEKYKPLYWGEDRTRDGVGIVVGQDFREKTINMRRFGDRLLSIKLALEKR